MHCGLNERAVDDQLQHTHVWGSHCTSDCVSKALWQAARKGTLSGSGLLWDGRPASLPMRNIVPAFLWIVARKALGQHACQLHTLPASCLEMPSTSLLSS